MKEKTKSGKVCIIGLGYVGLPLADAFSKHLKVIGFDIDDAKIRNLGNNNKQNLEFTTDPSKIKQADFVLICVPTPVTKSKEPDLRYVKSAAEIVGQHLKKGAIVVLESTIYPGVTEEVVKPILENESKMKCGIDFKIGYSPERINPGDEAHALDKITKIVAGMDEETTEILAELYGLITNVYKAKDIKTAEAAKVIENIQRDLNIALMNELAIIFHKMGLDKTFLHAKTFTKLLTLFLLRKKKYFFGKAFFKPFRKAFTKLLRKVLSKKFHKIASLKERFVPIRGRVR
jgi:UDPglucose 6-dehydrogenase/UDP-N-acetyl-D-galactosamine dehydrogenase